MPNNNYKDWLDLCQGNIQYGQNPEEFIEVQEAVTKTLSIVGTILGVTFPIAGAAVTILGEVIGLLWPSSADTSQNVWINFINSTEKLIDEKIDNALKITAVHELEGVQTHMYHYQNALRNWKGNPGNLSSRLLVRDEWNKAEGAFTSAMPHFRGTVPKDKVLLLAIYAHAANLHLLLLRDLSIYGTDWGYKEEEIALIYNKQLLLTIQYINYCIQTYNLGWNMVKDRYNSYLPGNKWNMVNTYRRNMTLKVLDIIALFSNYDNHKYPGTKEKSFIAQIIKAELTREVYTDANSDINFNSTFEEQEKDFTRGFNLFTWLEDLTLYTRNYANPPLYPDANFIFTANRNCIMKTNDTRCNMGNIYGNRRENDIATHINLHEMKIDKLVITHHKNYLTVILKIEFYQNTQRVAIYDSQSTTAPNDRATTILQLTNATESSQTNGEIYNHILSYIKTKNIIESTNQRQVACAWTHWSVDYNNTIQEKIITSIPAIKAEFSDDITIIQNPGHIGGELIQFNTGNSSSIQIACLTSNFIGTKNYGVRIRYAANKAIRLNATFIGVGTSSFVTNDTMTSSITEGKYLYQQFGYATIFTRDNPARLAPNRLIRFMINNPSPSLGSDTILVIDRIEIIPLDEFPTLLQDKQEIQRNIQTTTNNVFTDYTKNSLKPETTDYEIDQ
ncbi:insecticidal delta-endotoxin Cry8Ea1 family protein, partial [Bacillus thuringiensis]|uniref:insecticidal delta-endotoxin Cry8Ea1 family protein n=1 Tax=Bacillus thuringiensis TaxID=1428 RepID=UPI002E18F9BD